ncbi:MAG: DUF2461 domain-containing protein [Eubacteriales bacterium]|nr:DUF2461 domain-containing protein [Eubacteriales bacterium]
MFQGFTPETVDFLWGIRLNNDRDWFLAHKEQYVATLYEPTKALGKALFEPFRDKPGNILKVSRIYRDARMHHDTPYKESLFLCIRSDTESWSEAPCLFFEISPQGADFGFSYWQPKSAAMERFRKYIAAYPDEFLALVRQAEEKTGLPITAETYKRPREAPVAALSPYFAWRWGIGCIRHIDPGPDLFGPALADTVADFFQKLTPLYEYFKKFPE